MDGPDKLLSAKEIRVKTEDACNKKAREFIQTSERHYQLCIREIHAASKNGHYKTRCDDMAPQHLDLLRAAGYQAIYDVPDYHCYPPYLIKWK